MVVGKRTYTRLLFVYSTDLKDVGLVSMCRRRWYPQACLSQGKPRRLSLDDGSGVVVAGDRGARGVGVR